MEALQLIAMVSAGQACQRLGDSFPEARRVTHGPAHRPTRRQDAIVQAQRNTRTRLAGLLRRTADRVDPCNGPCPAPSAG